MLLKKHLIHVALCSLYEPPLPPAFPKNSGKYSWKKSKLFSLKKRRKKKRKKGGQFLLIKEIMYVKLFYFN